MSEEKRPKGQVETALEKASAELLKLTGGLRRVSFYVTDEEYKGLCARGGSGTNESFLEAFVADLTESERSVWKECRVEALNWHAAHMRGENAHRAFLKSLADQEGGAQ